MKNGEYIICSYEFMLKFYVITICMVTGSINPYLKPYR